MNCFNPSAASCDAGRKALPRLLLLLTVVCLSSIGIAGEVKRQIVATKTTTPPVIDGDISDAAWQSAAKGEGFTDFVTGKLVDDQTSVSMLYDDKFLYLAFDCHDSHPESITARETVRDTKFQNSNGPSDTEDNVQVDLDPFLTHAYEDRSHFSVNAIGTRSAAIAGGRGSKAEWKGDWDAAVKRTATGWSCEMRIPWQSFNYPTGHDHITIGLNFSRYIVRTRTLQEWSQTGPQGFLENEGLLSNVEVPQTGFRRNLSLLPYLLAGQGGDNRLGAKIGLDARYTITPQLTAVGTLNPDYSNVEGAIQSIAYSHSQHYVQETRPFFTEGGNYFDAQTNINDIGAFFYPQAIQRFDVGAKVFGKVTPKDTIGALDTWNIDSRNDFVGRYLHNFNATTSAGALVVNTTTPGASDTVAEVDDHFRWGKLAFESIFAGTAGHSAGGGAQVLSANYQDKELTSLLQYSGISSNFNVPDGYFPFTGYGGLTVVEDWSKSWRHGYWRGAELTVVPLWWTQNDGSPYYRGVQTSYNMVTKSDWYFELDYNRVDFMGLPDNYAVARVVRGISNRFCKFGVVALSGVQGGVKSTLVGPSASLRVFKKLDLQYSGFIQNRDGQVQQHILTANYEISPTRSLGGRMVTQNADTNLYFFYHNSGGKGTEFYVLYGDPNSLRTVRSLQFKLVFAV